jgi:hypothetical protein
MFDPLCTADTALNTTREIANSIIPILTVTINTIVCSRFYFTQFLLINNSVKKLTVTSSINKGSNHSVLICQLIYSLVYGWSSTALLSLLLNYFGFFQLISISFIL